MKVIVLLLVIGFVFGNDVEDPNDDIDMESVGSTEDFLDLNLLNEEAGQLMQKERHEFILAVNSIDDDDDDYDVKPERIKPFLIPIKNYLDKSVVNNEQLLEDVDTFIEYSMSCITRNLMI